MMPWIQTALASGEYRQVATTRRCCMIWETPQAVEMRFGMEITMYVSNR
jgi:coenzyme PQQ precursor peptide PqqA